MLWLQPLELRIDFHVPLEKLSPWRAKWLSYLNRNRWNSHNSGSQMNQNQCLQYTANQVHASCQIPAPTTQTKLPKLIQLRNSFLLPISSNKTNRILLECTLIMWFISITRSFWEDLSSSCEVLLFFHDKKQYLFERLFFEFTFFINLAISMASVTSKTSRALEAKSMASCCMVWSMSVSPITALPSSMMNQCKNFLTKQKSWKWWSLKWSKDIKQK